ncbi:MAG: energy transducer TonB [Flavobacterium sp.]
MKTVLLVVAIFFVQLISAQDVSQALVEDNKVYDNPEVKPEFPGGIRKFYEYVGKNFRIPEEGNGGKIIIQFIVEKDGSLTRFKVVQDVGYGSGEEAIRVLKACSTKWKPGIQSGKPVRSVFVAPITVVK